MRRPPNRVKRTAHRVGGEERPLSLLFDVWLIGRATAELLDPALAPTGLTAGEFALYSALRETGPIAPTQLARRLHCAPTTLSSMLKRLHARGHLRRDADPADGRAVRLQLSEAGLATHEEAIRRFTPLLRDVERRLRLPVKEVRVSLTELHGALRAAIDHARAATRP